MTPKRTLEPVPQGGKRWAYRRPVDAATLLVLDTREKPCRVLMGRRHPSHVFMPGMFVFPGGRVDRGDARIPAATELRGHVSARLQTAMRGRASEGRARGLALAALRETFEETGLVIGADAAITSATRSPGWQPFFETGFAPCLEPLHFVARAITPPGRSRRFDTRFFAVNAAHIAAEVALEAEDEAELLDLVWLTFDETRNQSLPTVTIGVIEHVQHVLTSGRGLDEGPVPFWHMRGNRFCCDQIA